MKKAAPLTHDGCAYSWPKRASQCRAFKLTSTRWSTKRQHSRHSTRSSAPPALQLDDGTVITESIAICRYFEELEPDPPLFGQGPLGKAVVEMWQRRVEFGLLGTVAAAFRHLHPAMVGMEAPQVPAWGEANKSKAIEFLNVLDAHLANSRFLCDEEFTVADITGLVAVDFMKPAKIALPEQFDNVRRWHKRVSDRPSARA